MSEHDFREVDLDKAREEKRSLLYLPSSGECSRQNDQNTE